MAVIVNSKKTFNCACSRCKSDLQYEYTDTREYVSTDYTGGKDYYRVIDCPVCRNLVIVNPK